MNEVDILNYLPSFMVISGAPVISALYRHYSERIVTILSEIIPQNKEPMHRIVLEHSDELVSSGMNLN